SIAEIAESRGLSPNTIVNHLQRLLTAGEQLDLGHLMPPDDRVARIKAAFQQTGDERLAPVRELLGEDYSYEELALVRLDMRHRGMFD
ncbi:MAG: helix-turn-helix domain-containing protein, partial [Chloroflexi bacterium]|nr:helix-turn-helix domain-containing protein [Chloroflexota bacterium]